MNNYKKCKPAKRFEVGGLVLPDDWDEKEARLITEVLPKGYKYLFEGVEYNSENCKYDPYMIWWGKIN
jgi:hypothetical protein